MAGKTFENFAEIRIIMKTHRLGTLANTDGGIFQHFHRTVDTDTKLIIIRGKTGIGFKNADKMILADTADPGVLLNINRLIIVYVHPT